jgi:hypothetical protein
MDEHLHGIAGSRVTCLNTPLEPHLTQLDGQYRFAGVPEDAGYRITAGGVPGLACAQSLLDVIGGETTRWSPVLVPAETFEETNGGYSSQGDWAWGRPTGPGPGGAYSGVKCWATNLSGYYHTYQWINLTSPQFDFSDAADLTLSFHHWYWIERYKDGGQVQVKRADGTWVPVVPVGGYDYETIPTLGPAFTGDSDGWQDEVFDISEYAHSTFQLRFRFFSDNTGVGPGWYIDDVALDDGEVQHVVDLVPSVVGASGVRLSAPLPNPSLELTSIAFRLADAADIRLTVCDAQGRCVRTLWNGPAAAGDHVLAWDGSNANGTAMPAGIYYVRLESAGPAVETRPVVRIR